jgi:hippurate hydrolase
MISRCISLALAVSAWASPSQALDVSAAVGQVDRKLDRIYPDLFRLYADLHAHPELSGQETRTAGLLAAQMRELGFTVTERVGGTGVVAVFSNGVGPTVMVRTELDGLPMEEKTGLPYASRAQADYNGQASFLAHSCGHDMHMAVWVGTARTIVAMKDGWSGTLVFIARHRRETH